MDRLKAEGPSLAVSLIRASEARKLAFESKLALQSGGNKVFEGRDMKIAYPSAAFLYIFPARVLRRTITMHVKVPEDVPALVLLNAALWGFFSLQLFWAPASVAVRHLTCRVGRRRQDLLNAVLFPARDAVLAELRALRNRVRQREAEQLHPLNVHNTQASDRCVRHSMVKDADCSSSTGSFQSHL